MRESDRATIAKLRKKLRAAKKKIRKLRKDVRRAYEHAQDVTYR